MYTPTTKKCKPTAATLTSRHISLFLSRDSVVASQQRAAMYGDTKVQVRSPSAAALTINRWVGGDSRERGCRVEHWVVARSEQSHAASTGRQRPPWPRRRRRRLAHSTREPRMRCRRMERRVSCLARRTGCAAAATTCACAALCASRPAAPARARERVRPVTRRSHHAQERPAHHRSRPVATCCRAVSLWREAAKVRGGSSRRSAPGAAQSASG